MLLFLALILFFYVSFFICWALCRKTPEEKQLSDKELERFLQEYLRKKREEDSYSP